MSSEVMESNDVVLAKDHAASSLFVFVRDGNQKADAVEAIEAINDLILAHLSARQPMPPDPEYARARRAEREAASPVSEEAKESLDDSECVRMVRDTFRDVEWQRHESMPYTMDEFKDALSRELSQARDAERGKWEALGKAVDAVLAEWPSAKATPAFDLLLASLDAARAATGESGGAG